MPPSTPNNRGPNSAGIQVLPFTSLNALLHAMTGDSRIEAVISAYAQAAVEDWKKMRAGKRLANGEDHKLDVFVKPYVSVLTPSRRRKEQRTARLWDAGLPPKSSPGIPGPSEFRRLKRGVRQLIRRCFGGDSNKWSIITEDAGGGKTVLSWYLRAALSRQRVPFLCVRYEKNWPLRDVLASLGDRIQKYCTAEVTPRQVIEYILEKKRLVLVLDALDQVNDDESLIQFLKHLLEPVQDHALISNLRVIVTSRPYKVSERLESVFNDRRWQHARLELFDTEQQQEYRDSFSFQRKNDSLVKQYWNEIVQNPLAVADLTCYPVVLRMIREIIEEAIDTKTEVREFHNLGDLYWEVAQRLLTRAFKGDDEVTPDDQPFLFEAISCIAFETMLRFRAPTVPQDEISAVKAAARKRFSGDDDQWARCNAFLKKTDLTDRCVMKENAERELSFPSLKMLEFFTGVYLGRYANERVPTDLAPHIGDSTWKEAWEFAIELPETTEMRGGGPRPVYRPGALRNSLTALFARPHKQLRPTELMFRAWQVLERGHRTDAELKTVRDKVLAGYRQQYEQLLLDRGPDGRPSETSLTAAELVPAFALPELVQRARQTALDLLQASIRKLQAMSRLDAIQQKRWDRLNRQQAWLCELNVRQWVTCLAPHLPAYARCPPWGDSLAFMMGFSPGDKNAPSNEKPWHPVQIPAFHLATSCVTRAQYRLFDPQLEVQYADNFKRISPEDDCPVIQVNWFDGFCLALWVGASLPTEVEWEGAAWGGIDRNRKEFCNAIIGILPYDDRFTSDQVNFNGDYPISGEKSGYLARTLPVRWSAYQPNEYGLWHMHGNVYEWCLTIGRHHPSRRAATESSVDAQIEELKRAEPPAESSYQILRGGSWNEDAICCHCALYSGVSAVVRGDCFGFRLCWRVSGPSAES